MKLYHISKNPNLSVLIPRVPNNYITRLAIENANTGRVCFAPTIKDCISAIDSSPGELYYVYTATGVDPKYIHKPKRSEVPDVKYTNEVWYLKPVNVKRIATVVVGDVKLWETFNYNGHTLERHSNNYKTFTTVPTEKEKNEYLMTQPFYKRSLEYEKKYNNMERKRTILKALAFASGGALLMLVGNKLLNMKKQ